MNAKSLTGPDWRLLITILVVVAISTYYLLRVSLVNGTHPASTHIQGYVAGPNPASTGHPLANGAATSPTIGMTPPAKNAPHVGTNGNDQPSTPPKSGELPASSG